MTDLIETIDSQTTNASDPVALLVGEGKKFADIPALARGKLESDRYIRQLEQEKKEVLDALAAAEAKATTSRTLDDVIKAVSQPRENDSAGNQPQQITPEDVTRIVKETTASIVEDREQKSVRKQNREHVNNALISKFEDAEAAGRYLADRARSLSLSKTQVAELSETAPAAFLAMLNLETAAPPSKTATAMRTRNTEAVAQQNNYSGERTMAWYQAERRRIGTAAFYKDTKLQTQMKADIIKLGNRFNDIDPEPVANY